MNNHPSEGSSSLDRAAALLNGWELSIQPEETNAIKMAQIKVLKVSKPEEILADILDSFPDLDETLVAEAFKAGILEKALDTNIPIRADEYAPVEELAKFMGMALINSNPSITSPSLNNYVSSQKNKLPEEEYQKLCLNLADAMNKVLVMRTLLLEGLPRPLVTDIAKNIAEQLGDESQFSYMQYRFLDHCLLALKDTDEKANTRIQELQDRSDAVKSSFGKHFSPSIFVPVLIEEEGQKVLPVDTQLNIAETQLSYLEKVATSRDSQKKEEEAAKKLADKMQEDREEAERVDKMKRDLRTNLQDIAFLESNIELVDSQITRTGVTWRKAREAEAKITSAYGDLLANLSVIKPSKLKFFTTASEELEELIGKVKNIANQYKTISFEEEPVTSPLRKARDDDSKPSQSTPNLQEQYQNSKLEKGRLQTEYKRKTEYLESMNSALSRNIEAIKSYVESLEEIKKTLKGLRVNVQRGSNKEDLFQAIRVNASSLLRNQDR